MDHYSDVFFREGQHIRHYDLAFDLVKSVRLFSNKPKKDEFSRGSPAVLKSTSLPKTQPPKNLTPTPPLPNHKLLTLPQQFLLTPQ